MGYINNRGIQLLVQTFNLMAHFNTQLGIQVRKRLIKQIQLRTTSQSAPHRDTLTLTTRKLRRFTIQQLFDLQHFSHSINLSIDLLLRHLTNLQTESDIATYRHVWIKRVRLEYHRNIAIFRFNLRHIDTINHDFTRANIFEPSDGVH